MGHDPASDEALMEKLQHYRFTMGNRVIRHRKTMQLYRISGFFLYEHSLEVGYTYHQLRTPYLIFARPITELNNERWDMENG